MVVGSHVRYRPLTLDDFSQFYNVESPRSTVKGLAFLIDDEVVGVAGVEIRKGFFYAFSDIKENVNVSKVTVWRCAIIVKDWLRELKTDVYACASEHFDGAPRLLQRLGFTKKDGFYVMEAA